MIRPLLSLERLSFSEKEGQVIYRYGESTEKELLMAAEIREFKFTG
jgi:hypothetical protein